MFKEGGLDFFGDMIRLLLLGKIDAANEIIDSTVDITYIYINQLYFYYVLPALHINENVYYRKAELPVEVFAKFYKAPPYIQKGFNENNGKD